jgi:hypothetical protein
MPDLVPRDDTERETEHETFCTYWYVSIYFYMIGVET